MTELTCHAGAMVHAPSCRAPAAPGLTARLAAWWRRIATDRRTAYLEQSADCADLERRMRAWDRCEQQQSLPLCHR